MIELVWQKNELDYYINLQQITDVILWLINEINIKQKDLQMDGYIVIHDDERKTFNALIFAGEGQNQLRILRILQQPPFEYLGRYIPCISCTEPDPIQKVEENEDVKTNSASSENDIEDEKS